MFQVPLVITIQLICHIRATNFAESLAEFRLLLLPFGYISNKGPDVTVMSKNEMQTTWWAHLNDISCEERVCLNETKMRINSGFSIGIGDNNRQTFIVSMCT